MWSIVAPHVGAWIETCTLKRQQKAVQVAPHVGAWIETVRIFPLVFLFVLSRPTWARGLKQNVTNMQYCFNGVAPHVGAWIETHLTPRNSPPASGRAPRGRVD